MIDDLEVVLKSAVTGVLKTMLCLDGWTVPFHDNPLSDEPHVAGCVGFIGGMTGVVYIYASARFASRMTAKMLGIAEEEIEGDEMINDAMGEITNMVVGNFKAAIVERGHSCVLTIPSIVRGSSFSIEAVSSTTRRVICFRCGEVDNLIVEILIKRSDQ